MKKYFLSLVISILFYVSPLFSDGINLPDNIYDYLVESGAKSELSNEIIFYFKENISILLLETMEGSNISGIYKLDFFPDNNKNLGMVIEKEDTKYRFTFIKFTNSLEYERFPYTLNYVQEGNDKFILKGGYEVFITMEGLWGTSLFPDGSMESIFFMEKLHL